VDTLEFLMHRMMLMGLPYGEVRESAERARAGQSWKKICLDLARQMRHLAKAAATNGQVSAAQAWRWTACAYHAASLAQHLQPDEHHGFKDVLKLRGLARESYLKSIEHDLTLARPVKIPAGGSVISGYLRLPLSGGDAPPVVVLLNGLDSLCEVEMHIFGDWMLARGLAVLALDLPSSFATIPRVPRFAVEELAPAIADWIAQSPECASSRMGAFGVSFGGHLVARLLAGDARFRSGVAVSPPAWMGPSELKLNRIRRIFACAFNLSDEREIDGLAARMDIRKLPPPEGRLLVYQMMQDQLFGPEHVETLRRWGGDAVEVRKIDAEHVGTSRYHLWLPEACDWLSLRLSSEKGCKDNYEEVRNVVAAYAVLG
jgi:dienelactone hydrolase